MVLATMILDPNAGTMTGEEIRDAILALDDHVRVIVITRPGQGHHRCIAMHRNNNGKLVVEYDDEPET